MLARPLLLLHSKSTKRRNFLTWKEEPLPLPIRAHIFTTPVVVIDSMIVSFTMLFHALRQQNRSAGCCMMLGGPTLSSPISPKYKYGRMVWCLERKKTCSHHSLSTSSAEPTRQRLLSFIDDSNLGSRQSVRPDANEHKHRHI